MYSPLEKAIKRGMQRSLFGKIRGSFVLLCLALAASAAPCLAGLCPVDLFREYDPAHPPAILTAPPLCEIHDSPYLDTDVAPPGTGLTFYRVNVQTSDPDAAYPLIMVKKVGRDASIVWGGSGDPAACCIGEECSVLCPGECGVEGGEYVGDGTSCDDEPPPCGGGPTCVPPDPFFGLAKASGGGVSFGGSGYPTLAPVSFYGVDTSSGAASSEGLTFSEETERVWNFTGAQDPAGSRYYYAGGRANHASIGCTIVTLDTASATLLSDVPLDPPANIVHLEFDHVSRTLYALLLDPGSLVFSGGHVYFSGTLHLASIDPVTGSVAIIAPDLPGELDHFAATLDGNGGRYLYHTFSGELHSVDLATGDRHAVSVPEQIIDLQFDDATGALYGLRTWGSSTFNGSGTDGYRTYGEIALVRIDKVTGETADLNSSPLPTGTTNWISAFDCSSGYYLYVSDTGESHVRDVTTGERVSTSPHPPDGRFHSLD